MRAAGLRDALTTGGGMQGCLPLERGEMVRVLLQDFLVVGHGHVELPLGLPQHRLQPLHAQRLRELQRQDVAVVLRGRERLRLPRRHGALRLAAALGGLLAVLKQRDQHLLQVGAKLHDEVRPSGARLTDAKEDIARQLEAAAARLRADRRRLLDRGLQAGRRHAGAGAVSEVAGMVGSKPSSPTSYLTRPDEPVADGKGDEAHGRDEVDAHVPLHLDVPLVRVLEACKAPHVSRAESLSTGAGGGSDGANEPPGRATQRFQWLFLGGGRRV
eukprot:scaffold19511_cov59-Phaeocystis_antarctica.AAC.3